jgi:HK97 family phage major capsid protein
VERGTARYRDTKTNGATIMQIDTVGLTKVMAEANILSDKMLEPGGLTQGEKRRLNVLLAGTRAIQGGATWEEIEQADDDEKRAQFGIAKQYRRKTTPEQRTLAKWFQDGTVNETRTETVGFGPNFSLAGNVGSFAPQDFFSDIVRNLGQHSPLWDKANVNYHESDHGGILTIPFFSDLENVAVPIGEGVTDDGDTDISQVTATQNITVAMRTPRIVFSLEALADIPGWMDKVADVLSDRLARGSGKILLNGSSANNNAIMGLIPSLVVNGAVVLATGSSSDNGLGTTSANSIGTYDISNLFFSVNAPSRARGAWLCNSNTLFAIATLKDKSGRNLINIQADHLTLMGRPVLVDEGLESVGLNQYPLVFGNLSDFWLTRICPSSMYLQRYWQSTGLVTSGAWAVRLFCRISGQLMFNDPNSACPIQVLQNVSS